MRTGCNCCLEQTHCSTSGACAAALCKEKKSVRSHQDTHVCDWTLWLSSKRNDPNIKQEVWHGDPFGSVIRDPVLTKTITMFVQTPQIQQCVWDKGYGSAQKKSYFYTADNCLLPNPNCVGVYKLNQPVLADQSLTGAQTETAMVDDGVNQLRLPTFFSNAFFNHVSVSSRYILLVSFWF